MTSQEAMKIKRLVELCLQINVVGKREVIFRLYPHIKIMDIEVCQGQWQKDKPTKSYGCYYDHEKDERLAGSELVQTYQEVVEVLEKILREDMQIWD